MSELHASLVAALAEMPNVRKTGTGNYGKFAELDEILDQVRPILGRHGLGAIQDVSGLPDGRLGVTTILVHKSGETFATGPLPMPAPNDPQKVGSSISYGRRYALMATLNLAAEDDDGHSAKPAPKREKPAEPTYSPAVLDLWDRLKAVPKDSDLAADLKVLAQSNGMKLTLDGLQRDGTWAEIVTATLDGAA
jgi:hypothetical protein